MLDLQNLIVFITLVSIPKPALVRLDQDMFRFVIWYINATVWEYLHILEVLKTTKVSPLQKSLDVCL